MRKIVFDIETSNDFVRGQFDPSKLDLALIAIHDSETNRFESFTQDELPSLWPIIEKTDILIGFNSDHFDIPLLKKYYRGTFNHIKSVDLMRAVKETARRRLGLNALAEATLGRQKTGTGRDAVVWWKNGEIEKVRAYCIEDVRLTKDLYEYALAHGHVRYRDNGIIKTIPLDTASWEIVERKRLTHTLPF